MQVQIEGLVSFLEMYGSQMRKILFSYGTKSDRLLTALAVSCVIFFLIQFIICSWSKNTDICTESVLYFFQGGCCPELKVLEINTKLDSGYCQLPICIQALQSGCPKLQVKAQTSLSKCINIQEMCLCLCF